MGDRRNHRKWRSRGCCVNKSGCFGSTTTLLWVDKGKVMYITFHINVLALGVGGVKWLRVELYAKLVGLKVLGRSICDCGSHARKGSHSLGGEWR